MPRALRSGVVYKFICAGCNACYVGQTTRHFDTRVHEHLHKKSQPSSVFKHLDKNPRCRQACDVTCFSILDRDVSSYRLQVKETIHNEWIQPTINRQRKLLKLSILIQIRLPSWGPLCVPCHLSIFFLIPLESHFLLFLFFFLSEVDMGSLFLSLFFSLIILWLTSLVFALMSVSDFFLFFSFLVCKKQHT